MMATPAGSTTLELLDVEGRRLQEAGHQRAHGQHHGGTVISQLTRGPRARCGHQHPAWSACATEIRAVVVVAADSSGASPSATAPRPACRSAHDCSTRDATTPASTSTRFVELCLVPWNDVTAAAPRGLPRNVRYTQRVM